MILFTYLTLSVIDLEPASLFVQITNYAIEVSVVMPGEDTPTFIAHPTPAPAPCPREHVIWPLHSINVNHSSTSIPDPQAKR